MLTQSSSEVSGKHNCSNQLCFFVLSEASAGVYISIVTNEIFTYLSIRYLTI